MSDQNAIVVQTCAKIAAELVAHSPMTDYEGIMIAFKGYFHEVLDEVNAAIGAPTQIKSGRTIPVLKQETMQLKLDEYTAKSASHSTSSQYDDLTTSDIGLNPIPVKTIKRGSSESSLTIKNSEMAVPEWLSREASKKGVTEVFDNRPNKADNPKRPDFVSTGPDKTGFWAPKER
jgi:hypothetical protein